MERTNQIVPIQNTTLDDFSVEELEIRLELGNCFHFTCQQRDWQGNCTNWGNATSVSYNVTPAQCTAPGDFYSEW